MCNASNARIARRVLEYLAERQDAQDTLEGIVEWWLVKQQIVEQTATVRGVLDELVTEGLLVARADSVARKFYSLNRQRADDISTYLKTYPG